MQLRLPDLHGNADRIWHEVPGDAERGTQGPGRQELSRRRPVHGEDFRLRNESAATQRRLLLCRRKGDVANTLDGLGVRSSGRRLTICLSSCTD